MSTYTHLLPILKMLIPETLLSANINSLLYFALITELDARKNKSLSIRYSTKLDI